MDFSYFDSKHRKFHRVHESILVPNLLIYTEKTADEGYLGRYALMARHARQRVLDLGRTTRRL
jgi:hypothetical protein